MSDEPRGRVVCLECHNVGMVEVVATGQGDWRPCSRCRPATFERWRGRHYERDHSCGECAEARRTQTAR